MELVQGLDVEDRSHFYASCLSCPHVVDSADRLKLYKMKTRVKRILGIGNRRGGSAEAYNE